MCVCVWVNYSSEMVIWKEDFLNQAENYLGRVQFQLFENISDFKFLNGEVKSYLNMISGFRQSVIVEIIWFCGNSLNLEDHVSEEKEPDVTEAAD